MSHVDLDVLDDGVALLTLDNAPKRNAIDWEMVRNLDSALDTVRHSPELRVLVVTGSGKAFCSGADLDQIFSGDHEVATYRRLLKQVYASFLALTELPIPTIAALNGHAVGAGVNIALACDITVAAPSATLRVPFSQIGLHPGGGATWLLVDALGKQQATSLLLQGGYLTAADALSRGLIAHVAEDVLDEALRLARSIAKLDPMLVADIRTSIRCAHRGGFQASLEFESWAQASTATGETMRKHLSQRSGKEQPG
jgi:enoyl-CoA hydratase